MKNNLMKFAIILAVIFGVHAAAASVKAQTEQITGGYGDQSVTEKGVVKAANFAVKREAAKTGKSIKLVKIEKAEVQVVAGLNYRVCMTVKVGRERPDIQIVTAVVYKNLKNRMSLTKWQKGICRDL